MSIALSRLLPSLIVDFGLLICLAGGLSILRPLRFAGIRSRPAGALALGAGALLVLIAWALPVREVRVAAQRTLLDEFVPAFQFHEFHSIAVEAPPERAYAAVKSVTADEILLFRTLIWIRRLGRPAPEGILNAPGNRPLLDVATRSGFLLLAEEPGREIVIGTLVAAPRGWRPREKPTPEGFKNLRGPGFALAAMNFRIEDAGQGKSLVTTETRVFATDAATGRRFAAYWRTIYPGSSLIRSMWLRAVKSKAEGGPATVEAPPRGRTE
jgi:hypothetical protein